MKYFKIEEFHCDGINCYDNMDASFLEMLDVLNDELIEKVDEFGFDEVML